MSQRTILFLSHVCNQCSMFASDCHIRFISGAKYSSRVHFILNQWDFKLNVRTTLQSQRFSCFRHSDTILGVSQITVGGLFPACLLLV